MNKVRLCGATALASLLSAVAPAAVWAQTQTPPAPAESATEVETLVVTARKREEQIQDVPAVVTALSGDQLEQLGETTETGDLVKLLPGVTFIESATSATAEPNIRGAGQARLPNSDSAVGLYRNGAYIAGGNIGGRSFQRFDLFDLQRAEALRGPQGALYGRNAVGGAINLISNRPVFRQEGEVTGVVGTNDRAGLKGIFNTPVTDSFALRLGFDVESETDGFYTRSDNGAPYDTSSYGGVRISGLYRPTSALEVFASVDYSEDTSSPGATISRSDRDGDIFLLPRNSPEEVSAKQYNLFLGLNWDLAENLTLVSSTNYRNRDSEAFLDADQDDNLSEVNSFFDEAEVFFQEVRLQGEGPRLNWLVGADLFYLKDDYLIVQRGRANIVNMATMRTINPNNNLLTKTRQTSYAAFGSLEYEVTDQFTLTGEARYSVDDKEAEIDAVLVNGAPRYTDFPPGSPQTRPSDTFDNISYGVTAAYEFTEDVLAFARLATAYRAGGFNSELGNPCGPGERPGINCNVVDVPPTYDEEHSTNYEVGLKTSWFQRQLLLNANAYYIEYDDILANLNNGIMAMADPLNGAMFLANAAEKATAYGFEIEMSARVPIPEEMGRLSVTSSLGKQEGEFEDIAPGLVTLRPGNSLARLRPWSATATVNYSRPVGGGLTLRLAGNYAGEWGGFQGAENDETLDDVNLLNGRAALETEHWVFALAVRNLLDEDYFLNQSGPSTRVTGISDSYRRVDPRSFTASLTYRW